MNTPITVSDFLHPFGDLHFNRAGERDVAQR